MPMSDALDYLVRTRPEAMGHYFAFLKDAGSRLDPKTRNLISVITKVHAQTERGLRQYVKRALRDGASPDEIVDALLMAFPALGLSKITWAVDVMLSMGLPGFEAPAHLPRWRDLAASAGVPQEGALHVALDGRAVFVARAADGGIHVFDSRCPHLGSEIPASGIAGTTLRCEQHGWAFDLRTGRCMQPRDAVLARIESRVENGRVLAFW